MKKLLLISGVVILFLSACSIDNSDEPSNIGASDFVFEETEFDFGLLKQSGGIVSHDFEFKYLGDQPITVNAVPTSCACATAEISQTQFENGDSGVLSVFFDPNLHEEPEGVFFKTANILTDPELEMQPEVKIWAEIDLDLGPEYYKLLTH